MTTSRIILNLESGSFNGETVDWVLGILSIMKPEDLQKVADYVRRIETRKIKE